MQNSHALPSLPAENIGGSEVPKISARYAVYNWDMLWLYKF